MRNLFLFVFIILCYSCKEELNPFEFDNNINSNNDTIYFDDPSSFSALHNNIFSTTCANSGCHDGTFEPDFRTIESSYNSLVYQPPIKNDANNSFDYRVKPGDAIQSVLYHRLIVDIDGISGIMPLEYEDDWGNNKDEYIQNIKDWIDQGAKDMFGNSPTLPNDIPIGRGMAVFNTGQTSNPFSRDASGSVLVNNTLNSVDVWFSVVDDILYTYDLNYNKLKKSTNLFNFNNIPEEDLSVFNTPINHLGYFSNSSNEEYYHKYTLNLNSYNIGDIIYLKVYVQDDVNLVTEIPNNASPFTFIRYFSIKII